MNPAGRAHRLLGVFINLLLLNLLWLLACLPVLTIFPATAAMFGVVRVWVRQGDPGIVRPFLSSFKRNFRQSFWVGFVWTLFGGLLMGGFRATDGMPPGLQLVSYAWFSLLAILYVLASVYLFPVMVHYHLNWLQVLKNSLLFSIGRLLTTAKCLLVVGASVVVLSFSAAALLVIGSVVAYAVYWLCDRTFRRVASLEEDGSSDTLLRLS